MDSKVLLIAGVAALMLSRRSDAAVLAADAERTASSPLYTGQSLVSLTGEAFSPDDRPVMHFADGGTLTPDGVLSTGSGAAVQLSVAERDAVWASYLGWSPSHTPGTAPPERVVMETSTAYDALKYAKMGVSGYGTVTGLAGKAGYAVPNINVGAVPVLAIAGAALSIGMDIASNMSDEQKALSSALTVANAALLFVPVVGWALAIVASLVKPLIMGLFGDEKTHEQREMEELERHAGHIRTMLGQLHRAWSPEELYNTLRYWSTSYVGGASPTAVDVGMKGDHGEALNYLGLYQRTPPMTADEFFSEIIQRPEDMYAKVQAGVHQSFLDPLNSAITNAVHRQIRMLVGSAAGQQVPSQGLVARWIYENATRWDKSRDYARIRQGADRALTELYPLLAPALDQIADLDVVKWWGFESLDAFYKWTLADEWSEFVRQQPGADSREFIAFLGFTSFDQIRNAILAGELGRAPDATMVARAKARAAELVAYNESLAARVTQLEAAYRVAYVTHLAPEGLDYWRWARSMWSQWFGTGVYNPYYPGGMVPNPAFFSYM